MPLVLAGAGFILWRLARQTMKQLVPASWATLADISLAVLLLLAMLLATAVIWVRPQW
jgi:hypothetical protein